MVAGTTCSRSARPRSTSRRASSRRSGSERSKPRADAWLRPPEECRDEDFVGPVRRDLDLLDVVRAGGRAQIDHPEHAAIARIARHEAEAVARSIDPRIEDRKSVV